MKYGGGENERIQHTDMSMKMGGKEEVWYQTRHTATVSRSTGG